MTRAFERTFLFYDKQLKLERSKKKEKVTLPRAEFRVFCWGDRLCRKESQSIGGFFRMCILFHETREDK